MIKLLGSFIVALLIPNFLYAQETTPEVSAVVAVAPAEEVFKPQPWDSIFDLSPLYSKWMGLGLGYKFKGMVSAEVFLKHGYTTANQDFYISSSTMAFAYGVHINVYPFSDANTGGFYTAATLSKIHLDTRVDVTNFPTFSTTSVSDTHVGRQIFLGYHHKNPKQKKYSASMRFGLGYGNGDEFTVAEGWKNHTTKDTMLLDVAYIGSF